VNKLSLGALAAAGSSRGGNRRNHGDWNRNGCGSLKTTKSLGLIGRDSGCDDGKDSEGNECELVHFG